MCVLLAMSVAVSVEVAVSTVTCVCAVFSYAAVFIPYFVPLLFFTLLLFVVCGKNTAAHVHIHRTEAQFNSTHSSPTAAMGVCVCVLCILRRFRVLLSNHCWEHAAVLLLCEFVLLCLCVFVFPLYTLCSFAALCDVYAVCATCAA
jgi:hypothetical protein